MHRRFEMSVYAYISSQPEAGALEFQNIFRETYKESSVGLTVSILH